MSRTLLGIAAVMVGALSSSAVTFTPNPADLGDLDHHAATTWGINWSLPAGQQITAAKLTIKNIYDWQREYDQLYIHLLDNPKQNVTVNQDNTADNVFSDYFSGQGILLTTWNDPNGGSPTGFNLVINFTASQINTLKNYLATAPTTSGGVTTANFGFGFDPDCHYYNDGVTFEVTCKTVPENGPTMALLGIGLLTLVAASRRAHVLAPAKANR